MPKAKNEPEIEPGKEVYWRDNLRQTISAMVSVSKDIGAETLRSVGVRIPGLAAAVVYAVNVTLLSPHISSAFGVYAFELLKDLGTAVIWKLLDSPEAKSEYYHSGKLEADIKRLLEKDREDKDRVHEYELEKKIGIILRETQAIQMTLDELVRKADEKMLRAFINEVNKYPEIYKANGESMAKWASVIPFQFAVPITVKPLLKSVVNDWEDYKKQETLITPPPPPKQKEIQKSYITNFPWGMWVFLWVLSVLIGAVIIVIVSLYFMDGSQSLCLYLCSKSPLQLSPSFTPTETQIIFATNTALLTVAPTLTLSPTSTPKIADTPTQQLEIPILFATTGTDINDNSSHSLPANTMVRVRQSFYNGNGCESLVYYDGRELVIDARALYENRNCP